MRILTRALQEPTARCLQRGWDRLETRESDRAATRLLVQPPNAQCGFATNVENVENDQQHPHLSEDHLRPTKTLRLKNQPNDALGQDQPAPEVARDEDAAAAEDADLSSDVLAVDTVMMTLRPKTRTRLVRLTRPKKTATEDEIVRLLKELELTHRPRWPTWRPTWDGPILTEASAGSAAPRAPTPPRSRSKLGISS